MDHVAGMGEKRKVYMVLVGKPEGKWPLRKPRPRWEDWIRKDRGRICWGGCGVGSFGSRQGQVAGSCEHHDEPLVPALWSYTDCIDLWKVSVKFFAEYVPANCKRLRKSYM
jgi:hypothetical protein